MRILMLCGYYEPEVTAGYYLLNNIAEDIALKGCTVDVVTPCPVRGVDEETRRKYLHKKREAKFAGNLVIHRVFIPVTEPKQTLLRALRYIFATIGLFFRALLINTDILLINSTPPTLGLIGVWLKYIKHVPAVYNLQDIFPDSMINEGIVTNGPLITLGKKLERYIYHHMDRIVVISHDFKRNILEKGVSPKKIQVIYNWTDENNVTPIHRPNNLLFDRYNLSPEKFYVTYCGNIGHSQNLELLADVAESLAEYSDLQFVIIGDGVYKEKLEFYLKEKNMSNVRLLPFQPYEDISHVFSLGDAGMVISKRKIGRSSFPSKTWSIMSAGRPVLASFDEDSELCTLINMANCGICVPPENFSALRSAILELYMNRAKGQAFGDNGRKFILDNLTRAKGTDKWLSTLKGLVNEQ